MALAIQNNTDAFGLGHIGNHLGFLSDDQRGFNPHRILGLTGLSAVDVGALFEKNRTSMYKDYIPFKLSDELKVKIIDLVMAGDIAYILFNKNVEETARWIVSPNTLLFGATPFEVCLRGDGKPLLRWLTDRAGVTIPDLNK
jgi:hypothetical protein